MAERAADEERDLISRGLCIIFFSPNEGTRSIAEETSPYLEADVGARSPKF